MDIFDNLRDIGKMKKLADDVKRQTDAMRATGRSKRGYVTVTLDGEKNLRNIEFSDDTANINREELAKLTKEAHQAAAKEIDKLLKKQMKSSGLANMIMGKK